MIKFRKITKKNLWDVVNLNAGNKGNKHVAKNSHTLLEAIFDKKLIYMKAIYHNNKLIGMVYYYPYRNNTIIISRFMIDYKYQGMGYGNKSFFKILNIIKKKHSPKTIEISTSNPIAIKLYKKFGFVIDNKSKGKNFYKKYKEYMMILKNNNCYLINE